MNLKLDAMEAALLPWSMIAAPVFLPASNRGFFAEAVGSGFIVGRERSLYFVTANHVVEKFVAGGSAVVTIFGKTIELEAISFDRCAMSDVAICDITNVCSHLPKDAVIPCFDQNSTPAGADLYAIIGYPSSRNKIGGFKSLDRRCFRILASPCEGSTPKKCQIKSPLLMRSYGRNGYIQDGSPGRTLPDVHGVSGGPVVGITRDKNISGRRLWLAGVIVEHYGPESCFVASDISDVENLIVRHRLAASRQP